MNVGRPLAFNTLSRIYPFPHRCDTLNSTLTRVGFSMKWFSSCGTYTVRFAHEAEIVVNSTAGDGEKNGNP